jgi:hypothetical protein
MPGPNRRYVLNEYCSLIEKNIFPARAVLRTRSLKRSSRQMADSPTGELAPGA